MYISRRWGSGLMLQFLILAALSFACSQAKLSEVYLKDIYSDVAAEKTSGSFNYDQQGIDWEGTCQNGNKQSPIALFSSQAIRSVVKPIRFYNYDEALESPLELTNNGHSASIALPATRNGQRAYINGGFLPGTFEAQSVHFHWGSATTKGSEHVINSERYDVEIHIVHKNIRYSDKTVAEASAYWDGLAVLGIMLKSVNRWLSPHFGLIKIFNELPKIVEYGSSTNISGSFYPHQLLADVNTYKFYSYNGSLTTPDCAESVSWTVFDDVAELPRRHIMKLWDLQESRGRPLTNNYRSIQNINNRLIYYNS